MPVNNAEWLEEAIDFIESMNSDEFQSFISSCVVDKAQKMPLFSTVPLYGTPLFDYQRLKGFVGQGSTESRYEDLKFFVFNPLDRYEAANMSNYYDFDEECECSFDLAA